MELLSGPKRHKKVLDGFENTFFWYYIKHSFIYFKLSVLSLGSIRLCKMFVGTIAGWKLTKAYVALHSTTSITSHYFDSHMAADFGILYCKNNPATML